MKLDEAIKHAEEYRQRMMQAFRNADCDELIALCVLPTEKEFEHLEWLLKNHYKKEPCGDCINRQAALDCLTATELKKFDFIIQAREAINNLPPVTPQPRIGRWIDDKCSVCGKGIEDLIESSEWYRNESPKYCPFCGLKLVDSQESKG